MFKIFRHGQAHSENFTREFSNLSYFLLRAWARYSAAGRILESCQTPCSIAAIGEMTCKRKPITQTLGAHRKHEHAF